MKFHEGSGTQNAEKRVGSFSCIYCKKKFNNYQALGGRHTAHRGKLRLKKGNSPSHSSNLIGITSSSPNPPANGQTISGNCGNSLSSLLCGATAICSANRFFLNKTRHLNAKNFSENNLQNAKTQFITSPYLLFGNGGDNYQTLSSTPFAPSAIPAVICFPLPAGLPLSSSSGLGSVSVSPCITNALETFKYALSLSPIDSLQNFQPNNLSNIFYPSSYMTDSYQFPGFNKCTTVSSLPLLVPALICKGGKRPYPGCVLGNADMRSTLKKLKTSLIPSIGIENSLKKKLPLLYDVKTSFLDSKIFHVAEGGHADIDLSLHL